MLGEDLDESTSGFFLLALPNLLRWPEPDLEREELLEELEEEDEEERFLCFLWAGDREESLDDLKL